MAPIVAVIAPGLMGAAVGKRLVDNGLKVVTSLENRSQETVARAKNAGMAAVSDEELASADFILSILPPGDALTLAERLVPTLTASNAKPIYVDCNAINPATLERVAAAIAVTDCPFVDAGIIGPPPVKPSPRTQEGRVDISGPRFYASGPAAPRFAILRDYGLDVRLLGGVLGAASALKMSHAGIAKGATAIGAAMILAATRAGSTDDLFKELQLSQNEMLEWFKRQLPHMPRRAYRWVAEMQEIAAFLNGQPDAEMLFRAVAGFYAHIADQSGAPDVKMLSGFFEAAKPAQ